jgi:hypothetical protein
LINLEKPMVEQYVLAPEKHLLSDWAQEHPAIR